jgi:AcrR family transcriptional regulator
MDQPDTGDRRHATDQAHPAANQAHPADRPNKNVARGEATRGQLVAIATRMFAERGYEDTSIEAVLREAGVSRGSLYHHFASKEALFEAVAEGVETSVGAQTLAAASSAEGPVEALRAASLAWIRLAGDPVVRRILLIDGPSVLGWERWRAMEEDHALGGVRAVLQIVADQGKLRPELVGTMAHVLLASVNEVALLVARSDDKEAAMRAGADAIDELLQRLFS